jgi:hypothetical protein
VQVDQHGNDAAGTRAVSGESDVTGSLSSRTPILQ